MCWKKINVWFPVGKSVGELLQKIFLIDVNRYRCPYHDSNHTLNLVPEICYLGTHTLRIHSPNFTTKVNEWQYAKQYLNGMLIIFIKKSPYKLEF